MRRSNMATYVKCENCNEYAVIVIGDQEYGCENCLKEPEGKWEEDTI